MAYVKEGNMSDETARPEWRVAPCFMVDDVVATANFYRDKLGFSYERFWNDPPSFCMVHRQGVIVMLALFEETGAVRPNRRLDPERGVWDAYIWIDDADALFAELKHAGVKITRDLEDRPYGCRDFEIEDCNGYGICFGQEQDD